MLKNLRDTCIIAALLHYRRSEIIQDGRRAEKTRFDDDDDDKLLSVLTKTMKNC